MDDLGFSLKNLFGKKKKKSALPLSIKSPFSIPAPGGVAKDGSIPGIAPAGEADGWMSYLPYIIGSGVVLIGIVVIVSIRKKRTVSDA
jgi:hypothetical protein